MPVYQIIEAPSCSGCGRGSRRCRGRCSGRAGGGARRPSRGGPGAPGFDPELDPGRCSTPTACANTVPAGRRRLRCPRRPSRSCSAATAGCCSATCWRCDGGAAPSALPRRARRLLPARGGTAARRHPWTLPRSPGEVRRGPTWRAGAHWSWTRMSSNSGAGTRRRPWRGSPARAVCAARDGACAVPWGRRRARGAGRSGGSGAPAGSPASGSIWTATCWTTPSCPRSITGTPAA